MEANPTETRGLGWVSTERKRLNCVLPAMSRSLFGRCCFDQGAPDGVAADDARRTDRGLDHRRHRPSQKGAALGWGVTPVLRAAWQAGELPGGGDAVACQSPCEPAGGVSAVFAERLGRGR